MTAPISNEPTTTRLHHYAGHYCLPRDYNLRVPVLCSVSLYGCAVAFLRREAHGSLCVGLIRIGCAHPDRLCASG